MRGLELDPWLGNLETKIPNAEQHDQKKPPKKPALKQKRTPHPPHKKTKQQCRNEHGLGAGSGVTLGRFLSVSGPPLPHLGNEGVGIVVPV